MTDLRAELLDHIERINRNHHHVTKAGRCRCWGPWPCPEADLADTLTRTLPHVPLEESAP